ncbi:MAG: FimB/Mfa2 family fimbrial subunit [Porphyromonas sp.]|nr:FimB/Mfa2 family fimbrial subunit [Porphyromonas sp.]MDO4770332.1 FimB/Mfa2 family fimbrial subunit [Porphyromonas sp.]
MDFKFVSKTPCGDVLSLDGMRDLLVQVYDTKGNLVAKFDQKGINITPDYRITLPFSRPGTYTFAFWGMTAGAPYAKTDEASCAFIKADSPITTDLSSLFYGVLKDHKVIDRSDLGTLIDLFSINMLPYTYRFSMEVAGLLAQKKYVVELSDDNGAYDFYGKSIGVPVIYTRSAESYDGRIQVSLNTLKLIRDGKTMIHIREMDTGRELMKIRLEDILRGIEKQNGVTINLECVYDLNLKLQILTHQSIMVSLNQWNFIYRGVILR